MKSLRYSRGQLSLVVDDDRPDSLYDPVELQMGIKVEMEHTIYPYLAKRIAKDHLDEFPNYYSALRWMENALRRGWAP